MLLFWTRRGWKCQYIGAAKDRHCSYIKEDFIHQADQDTLVLFVLYKFRYENIDKSLICVRSMPMHDLHADFVRMRCFINEVHWPFWAPSSTDGTVVCPSLLSSTPSQCCKTQHTLSLFIQHFFLYQSKQYTICYCNRVK